MAEVAERSGVRIVCATGLYKEDQGAPAYFKFRSQFGDALGEMTDLFVRELTEGVGSTGIRAGVIKVATGAHRITPYEELVLRAAARAHRATGAPITTHTDEGTMGVEQLAILEAEGVSAGAVVVGHSCGSSDLDYHLAMLDRGAYLGFDRFGLEILHPDRARVAALIGLLGLGFERRIVLSHDTVWCWRGRAPRLPPSTMSELGADAPLQAHHSAPARRRRAAGEDRHHAGREPAALLRRGRHPARLSVRASG